MHSLVVKISVVKIKDPQPLQFLVARVQIMCGQSTHTLHMCASPAGSTELDKPSQRSFREGILPCFSRTSPIACYWKNKGFLRFLSTSIHAFSCFVSDMPDLGVDPSHPKKFPISWTLDFSDPKLK